ncbi:hypothetical protein FPS14_contig00132-0002 [Flavobacterium psychrophilum]|nr:hypothetical protein FPS14_contig00132-0002 [Flavobacterium psychrophilum]
MFSQLHFYTVFYTFTDRNTIEKQKSLENALQTEQQLESDGRILRKPNILIPEKTKTIHSKVICTF